MTKKLFCILIVFVYIFTLTSCVGGEKDSVSVFYYTYRDDYTNSVRSLLDRKFARNEDIEFTNYNAGGDKDIQLKQIHKALEKGAKALVVNTASPDITQDITDAAKKKGVSVVFFDRPTAKEAVTGYLKSVFVSADYKQLGRLQGKTIGEYLVKNYEDIDIDLNGKISYVLYKGEKNSEDADNRTDFCIEEADKALSKIGKPAIEYYDKSKNYHTDSNGMWSSDFAKKNMTEIIEKFESGDGELPEIVIANNDAMALGAAEALRQYGYNGKSGKKTVAIFGIGGTQNAENAINSKLMTASVDLDEKKTADVIVKIVFNFLNRKNRFDDIDSKMILDNWKVTIDADTTQ